MTDLEALNAMAEANEDVRLVPLSQVCDVWLPTCAPIATVSFSVDSATAEKLRSGRFVGGLYLADREQFRKRRRA